MCIILDLYAKMHAKDIKVFTSVIISIFLTYRFLVSGGFAPDLHWNSATGPRGWGTSVPSVQLAPVN